ncbi:MAG: SIS domain-containing protein [Sulfuricurvum sp.]|nr:SIS domain-containing protein [Sulfuricurvum sp.]
MSLQSNQLYINNLIQLLQNIDYEIVDQIIKILEEAAHKQSSIYIIGNGGSSATASHMVNDLGAGLRRRGLINLDITSLADNVPVITAIANDIGYENIFYMQLEGLLKPEDLIIAISCSGNSPNIVKAVEYAKNIGSTIIGITGFDGGDLKKLSDVNFHIEAPKGEYGLVEDMHMILDHMIYSYYINKGKINVG